MKSAILLMQMPRMPRPEITDMALGLIVSMTSTLSDTKHFSLLTDHYKPDDKKVPGYLVKKGGKEWKV